MRPSKALGLLASQVEHGEPHNYLLVNERAKDVYTVVLRESGSLDNRGLIAPRLTLLDAAKRPIAKANADYGRDVTLTAAVEPGEYVVKVAATRPFRVGSYGLSF